MCNRESYSQQHFVYTHFPCIEHRKFKILGTPFLEKYVETIKCSSHTLEIKHNNDIKSLKFYDSSIKPPHIIHDYFQ